MKTFSRTRKLLALHLAALCVLLLLVVKYTEEIQAAKEAVYYTLHPVHEPGYNDDQMTLRPVQTTGDEWFAQRPLIYHAGGEIEGNHYTNSREAVENTLAEGGRFIEMDLIYTSDGQLVCTHTWTDAYLEDVTPTLEEFTASKIQGKFTPLTAEELLRIMAEHPQMYLVTDVKDDGALPRVIGDLVDLAGRDQGLLERFIIQLYTGREKPEVQAIYPFADEQFLFTTYNWGQWQLEVAQICNQENIAVITVPYGEMSDEDAALMDQLGFTVYEHTVNRADEANRSLQRGISGFYTDTLFPEDLQIP